VACRELQASGREYLQLVTALLQRARTDNAKGVIWEAADLQWWWRRDQHPDPKRQTFWLDDDGTPVAALVFTDWNGRWGCDTINATGDQSVIRDVLWPRAVGQIDRLGTGSIEATATRPEVAPLADGFTLVARSEAPDRAHHMMRRNGDHVARRLAECSLYRPELDLAVYAPNGDVAAYGLFWADPVTGVGLVEPMRTEDAYQRLGLARHVLTSGLAGLTGQGCSTIKVSYLEGNDAARRLYLGVGFEPGATARTYRLHR
jgi:GNAT superfamily N-acetyltransferase